MYLGDDRDFGGIENDLEYFEENFAFDQSDPENECENCGIKENVSLYNGFGQTLRLGGFPTDKMLCDSCATIKFGDGVH